MRRLLDYPRARATQREIAGWRERRLPLMLHLGCGDFLLEGWLNLDIEPRSGAFFLDARAPLPLPESSVHRIFHEHFLEHLELNDGLRFLCECHRVLEPGGIMRLSTPDLALTIATYLDQNPHVARQVALERHARLTHAKIPVTAAMLFNDKLRHWGHQFIYDRETLVRRLELAGFEAVTPVRFGESARPELRGLERHADVGWMRHAEPLIVEARKPERK